MTLRCIFGHQWSLWSDVYPKPDGSQYQWRYCVRCRHADARIVR